ncbi:hypothetical protein [Clostridium butyricum]
MNKRRMNDNEKIKNFRSYNYSYSYYQQPEEVIMELVTLIMNMKE